MNGPRARPTDAPALRELRIEALRLHPVALTADLASTEAQPMSDWIDLATRGQGEGGEAIYVVEDPDDGRLLGMTGIYSRADRPKLSHTAMIWGVYVRKEARGQKLGDTLVCACLDWARQKGIRVVKLGVACDNVSARTCYQRCGFVEYGVEPDAILVDGRYHDESLMYLRLLA